MSSVHYLNEGDKVCSICMLNYDTVKHIPDMICCNQHVVCEMCLWQMFIEPEVEFVCPYCKQKIENKIACAIRNNDIKSAKKDQTLPQIKEVEKTFSSMKVNEKSHVNREAKIEKKEVTKSAEKMYRTPQKVEAIKPAEKFEVERKVVIQSGEKKPGQGAPVMSTHYQPVSSITFNNQGPKYEVKRVSAFGVNSEAVGMQSYKEEVGAKGGVSGGKINMQYKSPSQKKEYKK